ncbi:MAG: Hpt domain-containing protein, partial [Alphaproteobacteria bacterium]|nr:Hpt domain-containing protein [Alphaproteobacteria bacterium]
MPEETEQKETQPALLSTDVIDPTSVMKSLFGRDRPDRFRKLLDVYVRSGEADIEQIRQAFADKNLTQIAALMHKMKSSSRSLGVIKMADFCIVCERAAKASDWNTLNDRIKTLDTIWPEILTFHENY